LGGSLHSQLNSGFFIFLLLGLLDGLGKLIAAGCRLPAAGVAVQPAVDLTGAHALNQLSDGLGVARAAAVKLDVADYSVIYVQRD